MEPTNFHPVETKRKRQQKPERHDARKFIAPIRAQVREAFSNTGDSEHVARHFERTIRSTVDLVVSGHDAAIEGHGQRLEAIERRLGMGRATSSVNRLAIVATRKSA